MNVTDRRTDGQAPKYSEVLQNGGA